MLWTAKKAGYRILQAGSRIGVHILDLSEPVLLKGAGSVKKLPEVIKQNNITRVLIVRTRLLKACICSTGCWENSKSLV